MEQTNEMTSGRAVIAVIHFGDKILVGKKRNDIDNFFAGKWHIPAETVEDGESDEDALVRGMMEETGMNVKVGKFIASHFSPTKKRVFWYECFADSNKAFAGSDLEEVKWVSKKEALCICEERVLSFWPPEVIDYFQKS